MRTGDAACCADGPDASAWRQLIAGFHVDAIQMAVHRDEARAVIDEDRVAVEEELAHLNHFAGSGRDDRSSFRGRDVHAGMGLAWLAIEEPARAERIGTRSRHRRGKRERKISLCE